MSKRYTLSEIKRINQDAGGYFFSRDTLAFFGNTMRDFKVYHVRPLHSEQEIYIQAHNHNAPAGVDPVSVYRFNPDTGDISRVDLSASRLQYMRKHKIDLATYQFIARASYEQA